MIPPVFGHRTVKMKMIFDKGAGGVFCVNETINLLNQMGSEINGVNTLHIN